MGSENPNHEEFLTEKDFSTEKLDEDLEEKIDEINEHGKGDGYRGQGKDIGEEKANYHREEHDSYYDDLGIKNPEDENEFTQMFDSIKKVRREMELVGGESPLYLYLPGEESEGLSDILVRTSRPSYGGYWSYEANISDYLLTTKDEESPSKEKVKGNDGGNIEFYKRKDNEWVETKLSEKKGSIISRPKWSKAKKINTKKIIDPKGLEIAINKEKKK
jgi:hypothetical protein